MLVSMGETTICDKAIAPGHHFRRRATKLYPYFTPKNTADETWEKLKGLYASASYDVLKPGKHQAVESRLSTQ